MSAPTMQEQAAALLRRARVGIAFAAACDNEHGFQFWQGYAEAAADMLSGKTVAMAQRDAELADQPQTRHEAAGAALPESTKNLTMAQVRQILATQCAKVAPDSVANVDVCAGEVLEHSVVAGVNGNEHAPARVHVGDGSGAHGCCSAIEEKAIVAQGGTA